MSERMKVNSIAKVQNFTNLVNFNQIESLSLLDSTNIPESLSNDSEDGSDTSTQPSMESHKYLRYINSQSSEFSLIDEINTDIKRTKSSETKQNSDLLNSQLFLTGGNFRFPSPEKANNKNNIIDEQSSNCKKPKSLKTQYDIKPNLILNTDDKAVHAKNLEKKLATNCLDQIGNEFFKSFNDKQHAGKHKQAELNQTTKSKPSPENLNKKDEETKTEKALHGKYETIKMYRKTLEHTKDPELVLEYVEYLLKIGLEVKTYDSSVSKEFFRESCSYLKKLSVKGYPNAQYLLADIYSTDLLGFTKHKKALTLFQAAAKHGHIESAFRTADCYEKGLGVGRDSRKSIEFLKFAASRNHTRSMLKMGMFFFYGKMGVSQDYITQQNGINWLARAAATADISCCEAPYELAKIYEKGFLDIIISDYKYCLNLYIQAASLGHTKSKTKLAQVYETGGLSVKPNKLLSIHYYTEASECKNPDPHAQLKLCSFYLSGIEGLLDRDLTEAYLWAEKAALLGFSKAQYTLATFYERGVGCKVDKKLAFDWYSKAADNKNSKANEKMQNLIQEMEFEDTENPSENSVKNKKILNDKNGDYLHLTRLLNNNELLDVQTNTRSSLRESSSLFSLSKIFNSSGNENGSIYSPKNNDLLASNALNSNFALPYKKMCSNEEKRISNHEDLEDSKKVALASEKEAFKFYHQESYSTDQSANPMPSKKAIQKTTSYTACGAANKFLLNEPTISSLHGKDRSDSAIKEQNEKKSKMIANEGKFMKSKRLARLFKSKKDNFKA